MVGLRARLLVVSALVGVTALLGAGAPAVAGPAADEPTEPRCPIGWEPFVDQLGRSSCLHGDGEDLAGEPVARRAGFAAFGPGDQTAPGDDGVWSAADEIPDPRECGSGGADTVQILWVHDAGHPSAPTPTEWRTIQANLAGVDWIVRESAAKTDADATVRWHVSGNCEWQYTTAQVSSPALSDFGTMIGELQSGGFASTNRNYLVFTPSDAVCGIAQVAADDRPDPGVNRHNDGGWFARVDKPCWEYPDFGHAKIAAHELFHTFGAVQTAAPGATPGQHCVETNDVLCYDDGSMGTSFGAARASAPSCDAVGEADRLALLDCNDDTYFAVNPAPGSWLTTKWNTADSKFLTTADVQPVEDPVDEGPDHVGAAPANGMPVVGDFDGNGHTDIFWYRSGDAVDELWLFDTGGHVVINHQIRSTYVPIVGDFSPSPGDEIFWYGAGDIADYLFEFDTEGDVAYYGFTIRGQYRPFAADLDGNGFDDLVWYGVGHTPDYLFHFDGSGPTQMTYTAFRVSGDYVTLTGDFLGTGADDILWYGEGDTPDYLFTYDENLALTYETLTVRGTYTPMAGDFLGDGRDDIFWYGEGALQDYVFDYQPAGEGDMTYQLVTIQGSYDTVVFDRENDGIDEVLFAGAAQYLVTVTENGLAATQPQLTGDDFVTGDFDADGGGDILGIADTVTAWWSETT